jgi:hypothetical protein
LTESGAQLGPRDIGAIRLALTRPGLITNAVDCRSASIHGRRTGWIGKLASVPEHVETGRQRTRYVRRGIGVVVGCSPVFVLAASIVQAVIRGDEGHAIGLAVMFAALVIGGLNFYLSFLRGLLYRRTKGTLDGYKHVSGFPMLGSLLVVVGTLVGFGSALCAALGLLVVALDTGGSVWFLIATWKDSSLWDR